MLLIYTALIIAGSIDKNDALPTYEMVKKELENFLDKKQVTDNTLIYWTLNHLIASTVGGRWLPLGKLSEKE